MKNPSVRYWKSRGAFCCWINRVQHILAKGPNDGPTGPTFLAAHDRFSKLLSLETNKGTDEYLVSSLLNQYRVYLKKARSGSTVPGIFEVMARGFAAEFGTLRVCDLKPYEFDAWLNKQTQWNPTSKAHAVALIMAGISWAVKKGFIQTNPLVGKIEKPQAILRGREARMSEELMDLLIGECFEKATYNRKKRTDKPGVHVKKSGFCEPFGRLLWLLRLTGARPVELRRAEGLEPFEPFDVFVPLWGFAPFEEPGVSASKYGLFHFLISGWSKKHGSFQRSLRFSKNCQSHASRSADRNTAGGRLPTAITNHRSGSMRRSFRTFARCTSKGSSRPTGYHSSR